MQTHEPPSPAVAQPMRWSDAWISALTRPSVAAYEALVSQPAVSTSTASLWVFLASTIGSILGLIFVAAFPSLDPLATSPGSGTPSLVALGTLALCAAPMAGLFSVLGLYLTVGISHLVARALGGVGTFSQLAYAVAAYTSPISLIATPIGVIPLLNCLGLPIGLYAIFLNVLSVKAVHKFGWGRAILSSAVIVGLLIALLGCVVIVVLALLGPAIGNVFSGIITEISTPAP